MTPRALDDESVLSKLSVMRRFVRTLEELGPFTVDRLNDEWRDRLVAERAVTALVDLAVAINTHLATVELGEAPHDYTHSFAAVARAGVVDKDLAKQLAPSVGIRNVLIHAYLDTDLDQFAEATRIGPRQYGEYVRQVASWLQKRSGGR